MKNKLRIGTRGSQLAMYQAELVKTLVEQDLPLVDVKIVVIKTGGDMIRRRGVDPFETKRIFTREIEEALLSDEVDVAVHSAKDMAAVLPAGLAIGAVLKREDPRDCLISKEGKKLSELPLGSRIGTSSVRRKRQLHRLSPELVVEDVHGNVDTRLRKLDEGDYDAIMLAHAGMKRLGLTNYVAEVFSEELFFPAPGQGTIVVQVRAGDTATSEVVCHLNHKESEIRLTCERAFLKRLEGGCQLPCGIFTQVRGDKLFTRGALFAIEDSGWAEAKFEGSVSKPELVGMDVADEILLHGGKEILDKIREGARKK